MKKKLSSKDKERISEIAKIATDISEMISEVETIKEENKEKE